MRKRHNGGGNSEISVGEALDQQRSIFKAN
jgi:hypothetical protein